MVHAGVHRRSRGASGEWSGRAGLPIIFAAAGPSHAVRGRPRCPEVILNSRLTSLATLAAPGFVASIDGTAALPLVAERFDVLSSP